MKRKIPLIPTWLLMAAVFGSPFLRNVLVRNGATQDAANSFATYAALAIILLACIVLWLQRGNLPANTAPKRAGFLARWRQRRQAARQSHGDDHASM